ncbi:MAG: POTRA domain-containing protein, partial [Candidatus Entotheonellia bacterium]
MMTRFLIGLVSALVLMSLQRGSTADLPFDASKPIVEIEWRGKANLGQDEFLDLIGIQVGDTLERETIRRGLEKLFLKGFFSQIRIEVTPVQEGLK